MEKKNWLQLAEGAGTNLIMGQAMDLLDGVLDYKELMMGYACAMAILLLIIILIINIVENTFFKEKKETAR